MITHLVQILLPLTDNEGRAFEARLFRDVRQTLIEKFGGVTAYVRSPAKGLWKEEAGDLVDDEIVIYEVMVDTLDRDWWLGFCEHTRLAFEQKELVMRAIPAEQL